MLSKEQSQKLKQLIKQHLQTSLDASWAGALPPEERMPALTAERKATRNLNEYIRELDGSSKRIES